MSRRAVARYKGEDLVRATQEECVRRIRDWGGEPSERNLDQLRLLVKANVNDTLRAHAENSYRELAAALDRVAEYVGTYERNRGKGWARQPIAEHLKSMLDALPAKPGWHDAVAKSRRHAPDTARETIVVFYGGDEAKWWRDNEGKPSATELAVVSILAGCWPTISTTKKISPAEVIRAEARAIAHALVRRRKDVQS